MKCILFTVTNDLSYDQRMQRICSALAEEGYDCELIGRELKTSKSLQPQNFKQTRLKCWVNKGFVFYAEYNIRLFFYLMFQSFDIICSIDLDTILPGYFNARLKSKTQVYDAHEYFSEMEEIITRPLVHRVWLGIEKFMMKRIQHVYTIGDGYSKIFKTKYNLDAAIIRNVPKVISENDLHKGVKSGIIYQGAINVGRGIEEMILAMKELHSLEFHVYGDGPELPKLKELVEKEKLASKVIFHGAMLPHELRKTTSKHLIGLTLFSSVGEHHQLSLANRFFDYIQSGVPQVAMNYKEYAAINEQYKVGLLIDELTPKNLVKAIQTLMTNQGLYEELHLNCMTARHELNWEQESKKLIEFYKNLL